MIKKLNIKPITILIIVIGFLILLKTQFPLYRVLNVAMEPSYKTGEVVLVNKMSSAVLNAECVFLVKEEEHFSRIIGLPGQKIIIKDGEVWVDEVYQDELNTQSAYNIILDNHPAFAENDLLMKLVPINDYQEYSANLTISEYQELKRLDYIKKITRIIHPKGYHHSFSEYPIFPNKNKFNWSIDNFGPITVPKDCYFFLGDNRHQSIDSRYFGFVKKEDLIGTVMFKLPLVN